MRYKLFSWDKDVSWQYDAACLGVVATTGDDPFFHNEDEKKPSRVRVAKTFCAVCKVRQQCLDFALDNDCSGVWGGTTERERKRME